MSIASEIEKNRVDAAEANAKIQPLQDEVAQYESQQQDILSQQQQVQSDLQTKKEQLGERPGPAKLPEHPIHGIGRNATWASYALMGLAVIGSYKMKLGSEGAMMALDGALKGIMAGDELAYQRHVDMYNDQIARISAAHREELAAYDKALTTTYKDANEKLTFLNNEFIRFGQLKVNTLAEAKTFISAKRNAETNIARLEKEGRQMKDTRTAHQKEYDRIMAVRAKTNKTTTEQEKEKDPYTREWTESRGKKGASNLPMRPLAGLIEVKDPTGKAHYFPTQEAADTFKKKIGLK